jgi:tetratricopeptide (TPR) repeat protein
LLFAIFEAHIIIAVDIYLKFVIFNRIKMKKYFSLIAAALLTLAASGQDAAELINKANEAMKSKQYAVAFEAYDKAMNNLGDVEVDAAINFNVGFAAMQADKNEAALGYFDKAIAAGANVSKSWEYKASVYNKLKNFDKALESFEKAIETSEEENGGLCFNAAVLAFRLEKFEKTVTYFDKAIAANFRPQDAIFNKATALNRMNNDEGYKATLIAGNEKFPADPKIAAALANVYVSEGNENYRQGAEVLNTANTKVNEGAYTTEDNAYKAELAKANAQFKAALELLENAKKLDASNANAQKLIDAIKQVM